MRSTWQKIVYMWNTHRRRFVGLVFCLVLVLGFGSQVVPVLAQADPVPPVGTDVYDTVLTLMARALDAVFEVLFEFVSSLIGLLISIVAFDGFRDNAVIKIGWPIVRNAINMFVILGLLFIAIKNLLPGQGDAQGQLFKVLTAVVLMNFSQTIALLAVDLSQVITITFAQAISDIGAGNFIQLFGLQNYLVLAPDANNSVAGSGSQAAILFGTVLFKLVMLGAILFAIGVMMVAFVVRIVLLWFLIIVSPAAFFAFGLEGAFPMAGGIWKQWSDQFIGLLLFGPVLTFFLWLSLAIAAGGDMAATLDFEVDTSIPSVGLLAAAQPASILGTILAIIMIFIGIAVSAQVASSSMGVGAIMAKGSDMTRNFITRGARKAAYGTALAATGGLGAGIAAAGVGAMGLGAGAAGVAATLAGGASGYGATYLRTEGAVNKYQGAVRGIDRKLSEVQGIGSGPNASFLKRATGSVLGLTGLKAGAAGLRQITSEGSKAIGGIGDARMVEAEARMKERDSASLRNDLGLSTGVLNSNFSSPEQIADARAVLKKFVTDKDFASSYKDEHGEAAYNERTREALGTVDDGFFDYLDDKEKKGAKENFFKFKARNLHLAGSDADIESVLRDGDFKLDMLSDAAIEDDRVWGALGRQRVVRDNGVVTSMQEQITNGQNGTKKLQKFADEGRKRKSEELKKIEEAGWSGVTPQQLQKLVEEGKITPSQIDTTRYTTPINSDTAEAIADKVTRFNLGSMRAGVADAVGDAVRSNPAVASSMLGKIDAKNASAVPKEIASALGDDLADKLARSMPLDEVKKLPAHIREQVDDYISRTPTLLDRADMSASAMDTRRHLYNGKPATMDRAFDYSGGAFTSAPGIQAFNIEINQNPTIISRLPMGDVAVRDAVITELGSGTLKQSLRDAVTDSLDKADKSAQKRLKASIDEALGGVQDKIGSMGGPAAATPDLLRHESDLTRMMNRLKD